MPQSFSLLPFRPLHLMGKIHCPSFHSHPTVLKRRYGLLHTFVQYLLGSLQVEIATRSEWRIGQSSCKAEKELLTVSQTLLLIALSILILFNFSLFALDKLGSYTIAGSHSKMINQLLAFEKRTFLLDLIHSSILFL